MPFLLTVLRHASVPLVALAGIWPVQSLADEHWLTDTRGCKVAVGSLQPLQSATWTGECRQGFAEGSGQLTVHVDEVLTSTYEGQMQAGRYAGRGVLTTPAGRRHEGLFVNGRAEGEGLLMFPLGTVYRGGFTAGRAEGACSLAWPNGDHYRGQCKSARPEGDGELQFGNGDVLTGSFKLGMPSGNGRYLWADGASYEGGFQDGELHGQGEYRRPDGSRYTGSFEGGWVAGAGQVQRANGMSYSGPFERGSPTLGGTFRDATGASLRATQALREQLTLAPGLPQKPQPLHRYAAPATICRSKPSPQPPAQRWEGVARYNAFITVRGGVVTRLDVKPAGTVIEALHPQFVDSIERAVRTYDCPGDHVLVQPFSFLYQ